MNNIYQNMHIYQNIYRNRPTTPEDLKELSKERLDSLDVLYDNGFYDVVIADVGYPIELGLKAAICKHKNFSEYPNDNNYKLHKLNDLVELCELTQDLEQEKRNNDDFYAAWSIISNWNVAMRYRRIGHNASNFAESCIKCLKEGGVFNWTTSKW